MASRGGFKTSKNFFNLDASDELGTLLDEIDAEYGETISRDPDFHVSDDQQARMPEFIDDENEDVEPTEGLTVTHPNITPVNYSESPAVSLPTHPVVSDEIISFNCKCDCINKFDRTLISSQLTFNKGMSKTELDLVIMGRISTCVDDGNTTKPFKHKEKIRKRARCNFRYHDTVVCREFFLFVNSIKSSRFKALKAAYESNPGATPRDFFYKGGAPRSISLEESQRIVDFLNNTAEANALALPGRVPGFKKEEVKVLPSCLTIASLHDDYTNACTEDGVVARGITTFRKVWLEVLPFLLISKPSTDLCWTCHRNNTYISRSVTYTDEEKLKLLQDHSDHLRHAKAAREYMNQCLRDCKSQLPANKVLGCNQPLSGPATAHYSFDFAQQVHYPNDPQQPGPIYFKTPRKCGLFGVCNESVPQQVNYLIDEASLTTKGANAVISYIHHFLEHYGLGEKKLILHADNCCGQNKNNFMMFYLAWRCQQNLHAEVEMNFLVAGHTKFACDALFGAVKKTYRRTMVSSLDDLVQVVEKSARPNLAQLVGSQSGEQIVPVYDWASYFHSAKKITGIKSFHKFSFSQAYPGNVKVQTYLDSPAMMYDVRLEGINGLPKLIKPEGLDNDRQEYLYNNIREFCRPGTEDLVCPKPHDFESFA
ncbi:uncharacterized protein [Watersipora subatra]|uniref:uncharacterized protein n=1 Tax=Watersipora subatra TaxID=2589382 RepID=UPI00355C0C09